MTIAKTVKKAVLAAGRRGLFNWMPDRAYLKMIFQVEMGYPLNLKEPRDICEKIQWLKLRQRDPRLTAWSDKISAKRLAAEAIGEQYVVPLYAVWESADEIDISRLPSSFVLKCSHDQGSTMVCRDKASFDLEAARRYFKKRLKRNYHYVSREWPYKDIPRRVLAEMYLVDETGHDLKDYKFTCFNGVPGFIQVMSERQGDNAYMNYYDLEWNPVRMLRRDSKAENPEPIKKPERLQEMIGIARKLSAGWPLVRIDLYHTEQQVYFGEATFYPAAGFMRFEDPEAAVTLGNLLRLDA